VAARLADEVIWMRAHVGDRLVVGTDRIGVVIGVPTDDGSPPYIVKWLKDGHIAMVSPDQYSRIIPAGHPGDPDSTPQRSSTAGDRT
jgi:hypothetical protein